MAEEEVVDIELDSSRGDKLQEKKGLPSDIVIMENPRDREEPKETAPVPQEELQLARQESKKEEEEEQTRRKRAFTRSEQNLQLRSENETLRQALHRSEQSLQKEMKINSRMNDRITGVQIEKHDYKGHVTRESRMRVALEDQGWGHNIKSIWDNLPWFMIIAVLIFVVLAENSNVGAGLRELATNGQTQAFILLLIALALAGGYLLYRWRKV